MKVIKNMILMISIVALSCQIYFDISPNIDLSVLGRVIIVSIEVLGFTSVYLYYRNRVTVEKREKYFKILMWLLFIIYLINLSYLLFLDRGMGRHMRFLENIDEYLKYNVNLKPFASILIYINSYKQGYLNLSIITTNLLGNLIAFMPFAVFLPKLFRTQRNTFAYFITVSLIIIAVEVIQVITMTGTGDIDDYILNVIGSMILFFIMKCFRKEEV